MVLTQVIPRTYKDSLTLTNHQISNSDLCYNFDTHMKSYLMPLLPLIIDATHPPIYRSTIETYLKVIKKEDQKLTIVNGIGWTWKY